MKSQYQIILGGLNVKKSVRIGIYMFNDTRAYVYFSERQIERAIAENKDINIGKFRRTIEDIKHTVRRYMDSPTGSTPTAFTLQNGYLPMLNILFTHVRFLKPCNVKGNDDSESFARLVQKYLNEKQPVACESYAKKLHKAQEHLFSSYNTYLSRYCYLDRSFFLGLTKDYQADYGGYNSKEVVLIKIIDVQNRYKLVKAELDAIDRMRRDFMDLPIMTLTVFIVSTKPDSLISDGQSDINWSRLKNSPDYIDLDDIENLRTYLKSKKIKPLEGVKFKGEFSLVAK